MGLTLKDIMDDTEHQVDLEQGGRIVSPVHRAAAAVLTDLMQMGATLDLSREEPIVKALATTAKVAAPFMIEKLCEAPEENILGFLHQLREKINSVLDAREVAPNDASAPAHVEDRRSRWRSLAADPSSGDNASA